MPIELPNLDDRSFADLREEGRNMIPALAPSWTDHNLSDPGITLMELFAAVTEQLIYRTNRVTAAHKNVFLRLIQPPEVSNILDTPGKNMVPPAQGQEIDDALAAAIGRMRVETRAITAADYERLARQAGAAQALCLPRSKAATQGGIVISVDEAVGHVTLIVAPRRAADGQPLADDLPGKLKTVLRYVTALTTQAEPPNSKSAPTLHIVRAQALAVTLTVGLACFDEYRANAEETVGKVVADTLKAYFDYEKGGPEQGGWPLGQAVYKSTLYALVTRVPGVDYITELELAVVGKLKQATDSCVAPACYEYVEMNVACRFAHRKGG
jgi:hypothetical protein